LSRGLQEERLIDLLTVAAQTRSSASDAPGAPIALSKEGEEAVKDAVSLLLANAKIRRQWDTDELPGVLTSMIVACLTLKRQTTCGRT
jgi:hypothetical protein